MQFDTATREALKKYVFDIEKETSFLKERIKELEKVVIPKPLFVEPITAVQPTLTLEYVQKSSSKLRGSSGLLLAMRKYVRDGIHKRIDLSLKSGN
jgi:hypothetical protein